MFFDNALDVELVRKLSDADRALGELAGLGHALISPQLFIQPFIRREAVLSSRIEGTQAGIADLYTYEAEQLSLPGVSSLSQESDVAEVFNYVRALQYGLERVKTFPVSLRLIQELHEKLMTGARGARSASIGEFRRIPNLIGNPGASFSTARFVPPPVPEMNKALQAFEKYIYKDDYPPLIRLAFIHYQFETIHPFEDGNGRTGRLLISLLLVCWKLLPQPLLYLSAFFESHRQDYYDLLLAVSERGAWRDWVIFFLTGVAEQAVDVMKRAKMLQDLREQWRDQLTHARSTAPARLADSLFTSPVITTSNARQLLGISAPSVQDNINKLVAAGILRLYGRASYGNVYRADAILNILWKDIV